MPEAETSRPMGNVAKRSATSNRAGKVTAAAETCLVVVYFVV